MANFHKDHIKHDLAYEFVQITYLCKQKIINVKKILIFR